MLAFFEMFISFMAIVVWCVFYVFRCKGNSAAAPLAVISTTIMFYSIFACINQVVLAGWLFYALAATCFAYLVYKRKNLGFSKESIKAFFSPGMILFLFASMVVIVVFAIREPIFMEWDEFSFWGMAPKLVKETGQMYTVYPSNMRVTTFVPGLVMLSYHFQFIGAAFVQWKAIAAYNILFFAVFSAVLSGLKRKNWTTAIPTAFICFLVPYLLTTYYRVIHVSLPYLFVYADIPLGMVLAGALALYFSAEEKKPVIMVPVLLTIMVESILKDTGFALALVGAGIIAVDLILCARKQTIKEAGFQSFTEELPQKLGWSAGLLAGPVATFFAWAWHMQTFMGVNRMEVGGAKQMSAIQIVFTGLKELFTWNKIDNFASEAKFTWNAAIQSVQTHLTTLGGAELPEISFGGLVTAEQDFVSVMTNMFRAFFEDPLSMFGFRIPGMQNAAGEPLTVPGSGAVIVLVILAICVLAFLVANKKQKVHIAWFTMVSSAGFLAYYIFIGFTYVYVFNSWQSAGLNDYNRYIYPYYIAWMLASLAMLCIALKDRSQRNIGNIALLCMGLLFLWRWDNYVQPQLSVVNVPESYYQGMRALGEETEEIRAFLPEEASVFYICQEDNGGIWFYRYFYYFPAELDYSFGGGTISSDREITTLALDSTFDDELRAEYAGKTLTPHYLCGYLTVKGCDYILIDNADQVLLDNYGHLFTDNLDGYFHGDTILYKIEGSGDDMYFVPVEMEWYHA